MRVYMSPKGGLGGGDYIKLTLLKKFQPCNKNAGYASDLLSLI
jgi:hypothetical protein